jgi:hypothetical protein
MHADPAEAATALAHVVRAQADYRRAQEERREAIVAAVQSTVSLREVAMAAECSHESVRRMAAADGVVSVELSGAAYPLTRQTVELLIYKLSGYARGAFPRDVELLGAGTAWLSDAGRLGKELEGALSDEVGGVVTLDRGHALALYQVLRLTQMTIPSTLSRLYDALETKHAPRRR